MGKTKKMKTDSNNDSDDMVNVHEYYVDEEEVEEDEDEDEDEDVRQLPDDEKCRFLNSLGDLSYEPFFNFSVQRLFSKYLPDHLSSFHGIERDAVADNWISRLAAAQESWNKQHPYPEHDKETLVKSQVVYKLKVDAEYHFSFDRVHIKLLPDNEQLYNHTIKTAANLLCTLCSKDLLYRFGRRRTMYEQKVSLWNEIRILRLKGCSKDEVFENIVRLTADTDKYSFLTEPDIASIVYEPIPSTNPIPFNWVAVDLFLESLGPPATKEHTNQILSDIDKVVNEMELSFPRFQVDDYTRLLVRLLKGPDGASEEDYLLTKLLVRLLKESYVPEEAAAIVSNLMNIDTEAVEQQKMIYPLLDDLIYRHIRMLKPKLTDVIQPLFVMSIEIFGHRFVSHEIFMVVQVAEIRRMALGSRFIGRSHLIWAFYECGYGLPKLRNAAAYVISQDMDHPPYHIYSVAMKLAATLGLTKVRLEHFMFAVLFAQEYIFHRSSEQWSEMRQEFMIFEKDIALHKTEVEVAPQNTDCVAPRTSA